MGKFIPLSVPNLSGNEKLYVARAVETEWVSTAGGYVDEFERNIAAYLKVEAAAACQSGTAGLHLALKLVGIEADDEVIVPTLTFIAAVNPVSYMGAKPIFMDCDDTLNMDLDKLESFCKNECNMTEEGLINSKTKRIIRAIVIVHVFGNMADMARLMDIASVYRLKVVEDATEALGTYCESGRYSGKFAGTIGDAGVYSFNGNKIMTTGGGGMLVARDPALVDKARYLAGQAKDDGLYYIHHEIGYNYRMTNMQAALGVAQLEQLESFIAVKTRNYELYRERIEQIEGLSLLPFNAYTRPNYWFYSLMIDDHKFAYGRDELLKQLAHQGVQTRPIWGLIHEQLPYRGCQSYEITKASYYANRILNIPCSTNLETANVETVVALLVELQRIQQEVQ
jgi:perosamine synthetase